MLSSSDDLILAQQQQKGNYRSRLTPPASLTFYYAYDRLFST